MPKRIVKDRAAEGHLIGIWVYTFEQWSEVQADRYLNPLEDGINKLAAKPGHGKRRDELREGYWSMRIEHHVIFYTYTDTELRIRCVLHEVMDPDSHLCFERPRPTDMTLAGSFASYSRPLAVQPAGQGTIHDNP
jgi:toxin ParE1/3/4